MSNVAIGRTQCAVLQNKSGGAVAYGDVVIIDGSNAQAFTTTTVAGSYLTPIGVVMEPNGIASNGWGIIGMSGWIPQVNLSAAATLGHLFKTHTVAKQAIAHAAPMVQGDFGVVLQATATPQAILFGMPNVVPNSIAGDLWTEIVKTADQDVSASATLTNDSELQMSVTADTYHLQLFILYSGDTAAGDYKFDFLPSTGNMSGWYRYTGGNTTADAVNVSTGIRLSAAATITAIAAGTDAVHGVRSMYVEAMLTFSASATFNFRFAQNTLTAATVARTKKGSIIRYRKLPIA